MSTVTPKGPNPNISDKSDPRYTPLNDFQLYWGMAGLIGDADSYLTQGFEAISGVKKIQELNIEPNDLVCIGNRKGTVVSVTTGLDKYDNTVVTSILVHEELRYLPIPYQDNPTSFGYTSAGIDRQVRYILGVLKDGQALGFTPDPSDVLLTGNNAPYTGTILVMKAPTTNSSSWNNVAQAVEEFHS